MQSEIRAVCRVLVLLSVLPHLPGLALAQGVSQYAIQVSATVQAEPAQITLSWPAVEGVRSHAISRRLTSDQDWGNPVLVPEGATSYVDSSVVSGQVYEYQVARTAVNYKTHAYISAGFQIPLVESRVRCSC